MRQVRQRGGLVAKEPDPRDRDEWRRKLKDQDAERLAQLAQLAETEAAAKAIEDLRLQRDVERRDAEGT